MADRVPRRPRAPRRPASIGIFAPSGRVDPELLHAGARRLSDAGHRVKVAEESFKAWRYFAGEDETRLASLDRLIEDETVDIVIAARGGYGISRLLHRIDWPRIAASAKVFVGFSDFTAFNCAAYAKAGLVTLHGPMVASDFGAGEPDPFMQTHFDATVFGCTDEVTVDETHGLLPVSMAGTLWGGNLSLLAHVAGTPFMPDIRGGILFVEEIAEEPYAVERMFLQLHHAGILQRQKAILLGDFHDCNPTNLVRYPYCMEEVIETLRAMLPCPILSGLPVGHVARKLTLPFGIEARLRIDDGSWSLCWPGMAR